MATGKVSSMLSGHAGSVWSLAFSPDGKTLLAGSGHLDEKRMQYIAGEIKVWDVERQRVRDILEGHAKVVNTMAFSPDGKLLASGGDDSVAKLWDVADGTIRQPRVLNDRPSDLQFGKSRPPQDVVASLAFSPDGRLLAWGDHDNAITLWNVVAGRKLARLPNGRTRSVALSPDGKMVASGGPDSEVGGGCLKVWEVLTHKERGTFDSTNKPKSFIHTVTFGPTGRTIYSGSNEGAIRRWDFATGTDAPILEERNIAVYQLQVSPDGKLLAAVRSNGTLVVWDLLPPSR